MARGTKITSEILEADLIINGNQAQAELIKLEKSTHQLREEKERLMLAQDKLRRQNKTNTEEYKALTKAIAANRDAIKLNNNAQDALRQKVGLTSLSMRQLQQMAYQLRGTLGTLTPGTAEWQKYALQLSQVNNRLKELRTGAATASNTLGGMFTGLNSLSTATFILTAKITALGYAVKKVVDYFSGYEDQLANVRKTTGLAKEAVLEIDAAIDQMQTRTSRMQLLQYAEEAGRLGKDSVEDVLAFVRVADMLSVALGDDFKGDVETTIREIGKLAEVYKVGADVGADFEEQMSMLGSSINEVASSGPAQASFLVDYLSRVAGISQVANIAASDQIGLAAALDETAQSSEVAGTVMSNLVSKAFQKTADFAKAANIPVKEFADLLKTDTNEALLRFLEGVTRSKGGMAEFVANVGDLGIDGQRATSVLTSIASNIELVREKQLLASQSLYENTSLSEEATLKQENLAGVIGKVTKRLSALANQKEFVNFLESTFRWFGVLVGATTDATSSANAFREVIIFTAKALAVYLAGLVGYKTAMIATTLVNYQNAVSEEAKTAALAKNSIATKLNTIYTAANATITTVITAAKTAYATVTLLLTRQITLATAAQRLLNITMMANPFVLIATLVMSTVAAFIVFRDTTNEITAAQRALIDVQAEAEKAIVRERLEVEKLFAIARDLTKSTEERTKAIDRLNQINPKYLGNLTLENIGHAQAKASLDAYIESLQKAAQLKAIENKRVALEEKLIDEKLGKTEEEIKWYNKLGAAIVSIGVKNGTYTQNLNELSEIRKTKRVADINAEIKALDELAATYSKPSTVLGVDGKTGTVTVETKEEKAAREAREKAAKEEAERKAREAIAQYKALQQKVAELERAAELERMNLDKRELEQVRDKYAALYKEAKGHKEEIARLEVLEEEELFNTLMKQKARDFERQKASIAEQEKEKQRLRDQFGLTSDKERYDKEVIELNDALKKKFISQEEYEIALKQLKDKYARNYVGQTKEEEYASDLAKLQTALDSQLITYEQFLQGKQDLEDKFNSSSKSKPWADYTDEEKIGTVVDAFGRVGGAVNELMNLELARLQVVQQAGEGEEQFTKRKEDAEKERYAVEKKYAKIRMLTTLAEIVGQTALAVMKVAPIIPLMALMGVLGANQAGIAIAQSSKIQGYEGGLYPVTDQHGRNFNAGVVHNAGTGKLNQPTILAGEKPEIIIDPATTRHLEMNYPEVINAIYSSAARVRGYESGNYPKSSAIQGAGASSDAELKAMISALIQTQAKLEQTLSSGIGAYYDDAQVRQIRTRLEVNNQVKTARKL